MNEKTCTWRYRYFEIGSKKMSIFSLETLGNYMNS